MLQVDGVYSSVNQVLLLLEHMDVSPTIQHTKMLEQHFLTLDKQICECMGFYEDGDYSSDEDMLWTVPGCEIFRFTPSDLSDISGESIAHDFEYLVIDSDGIVFDLNSLDKCYDPGIPTCTLPVGCAGKFCLIWMACIA